MKKLLFIIFIFPLLITSCSDHLSDLNRNTKDPSQVKGEDLFSSGQKRLADIIVTPSTSENNLRLWAQYWQETTYPNESRYFNISRGTSDTYWEILYTNVLKNLDEAYKTIDQTDDELTNASKANKKAIIELLKVYAFANLTETYGDILYDDALDIDNTLPKYSDAKTVYLDLIDRINQAVDSFTADESFSDSEDRIYGGNTELWERFAQTLKLKMGLVLADEDPELAQKIIEEAYNAGVFSSNEESAQYHYIENVPNNNPINTTLVVSGRNDFVVGKTIVDKMEALNDPRRAFYFDANLANPLGKVVTLNGNEITVDSSSDAQIGDGVYIDNEENPAFLGYISAINGTTLSLDYIVKQPEIGEALSFSTYRGGEIGTKSLYTDNSHVHQAITSPDFPGTLLSYAEAEFLLAEAAERGFNVGPSAETHYKAGIKASFDEWGAPDVEAYLAKATVDYTQAKSNSTSNPAWKEVIGTQAWLALYNRTFASWLSIRRLDYPKLTPPERRDSDFPLRYTYPTSEQNLNGPNWQDAATKIGGDQVSTSLFWDTVDPQTIWNWD